MTDGSPPSTPRPEQAGVSTSWERNCLTIVLASPRKRNALSPCMVEALSSAFDAAWARATAVVVRADGPDFCAGFDLSDVASLSDGDLLLRFVQIELMLERLWTAPFMTVAMAGGRALGAGADLFACCDVRIAHETSRFRFPGSGFGLVLGVRRLAERIGRDAARELHRSGRSIRAGEAVGLKLVTHLETPVSAEATLSHVLADVERLDRESRSAVHRATAGALRDRDADLADVVRSASRSGLRDRILAYRDAALRERRTAP